MHEAAAAPRVFVAGAFDDLRSRHLRVLQEASRLGTVHLLLWSDELCTRLLGTPPKFSESERSYFVGSVRFVSGVGIVRKLGGPDELPAVGDGVSVVSPSSGAGGTDVPLPIGWRVGDIWLVGTDLGTQLEGPSDQKAAFCRSAGLVYRTADAPGELPAIVAEKPSRPWERKVVVTGSFDWLHTGHVRFFEEAAAYGQLLVVVGHDENIRLLKGAGHPLLPQQERQYMAAAIRFVSQALISTGSGWLDAEPEIRAYRPSLYVVNEDGDRPEKRAYCEQQGMHYLVLRRTPKEGLPRRSSTALRGF